MRDGRELEVSTGGDPDGLPLVFHTGTPSAPAPSAWLDGVVAGAGLRLITWARPGYGASERQPGRTVADVVTDTTDVLDALGVDRFVTLGWSGGGPHALACGALLPERCRAVASLAGVAPYDAAGLDWTAGMGPENVDEFGRAASGSDALAEFLAPMAGEMASITPAQVSSSLGGLVPDIDRAHLTGEYAEWVAATFRRAFAAGYHGILDDDLAFVAPWGFDVADVAVPVSVWQGGADLMVPFAHGQWLAEHLPGARAHLLDDEGHLSIVVGRLGDVLAELAGAAS